jgi:hypothetical protein
MIISYGHAASHSSAPHHITSLGPPLAIACLTNLCVSHALTRRLHCVPVRPSRGISISSWPASKLIHHNSHSCSCAAAPASNSSYSTMRTYVLRAHNPLPTPFSFPPSVAQRYGKHCAECRQLDFLAVECSGCELWFCGAHGLSHQLSCAAASLRKGASLDSALNRATNDEGNAARATKPKVKRCKKSGCRKAIGLVSHTCARCALSFCMAHRFQTDHDCASASTTHGSSRTPAQSCAAEAARSRVAVARAPQRTTQQVY